MRRVRYLDEARAEFLHEIGYFTDVSPRLAKRFDEAVQRAENQAAEFADMGMPYKYGTRRVLLRRKFKFSLVYLTYPSEVIVIALASFSRKPGYWKSRIAA